MYQLCAVDQSNEQFFVDGVAFNKNARILVDKKIKDTILIIFERNVAQYYSVRMYLAGRHQLPMWALRECIKVFCTFFLDIIFPPQFARAS